MRKFLVIFLFLFGTYAFSQYPVMLNKVHYLGDVADGTDITASLTNLISASVDGDVIVLPKGKFKLSGQINISGKDLSILGHGADSISGTMLYKTSVSNMEWFLSFSNTNTDFNSIFFISGIYFKSIKNSETLNNGIQFIKNKNWIMSDNTLQNMNTWSIMCYHEDYITGFNGLIFKNRIIDPFVMSLYNYGYGSGVGSASPSKWITDPEFGSEKFVFIEDNYFYKTRHAVASSGNGKYVFRHNTVRDNWVASAIDMHGGGAFGNVFSARASEIYNNDIETTIDSYGAVITGSTIKNHYVDAIGIRGGESLIYSNTVGNYLHYLGVTTEVSGTYPVNYQIGFSSAVKYGSGDSGYATDHGNGDIFYWDPIYTEKYPEWGWTKLHSYSSSSLLAENRDYHNVQETRIHSIPISSSI